MLLSVEIKCPGCGHEYSSDNHRVTILLNEKNEKNVSIKSDCPECWKPISYLIDNVLMP